MFTDKASGLLQELMLDEVQTHPRDNFPSPDQRSLTFQVQGTYTVIRHRSDRWEQLVNEGRLGR